MRLAKKLLGRGHMPHEWTEFYEAHTPYEWAIQKACEQVEPTGDDRADIRQAINTRQIVSMLATGMDEEKFASLLSELRFYLKIHEQNTPTVGPASIRQALGE